MPDVYVGLGSNVEPALNLLRGVDALARRFGPLRCSDVYASAPVGFEGPDFLNMVVAFDAQRYSVDDVERMLTEIEYPGGASRVPRFTSRALDLDLLLYGALVDASRGLPRADVTRYAFVLRPLQELAPALRHPLSGRRLTDLWRDCSQTATLDLRRAGSLETLRRDHQPMLRPPSTARI